MTKTLALTALMSAFPVLMGDAAMCRVEPPSELEFAILESRRVIHSIRATYTHVSKGPDRESVTNKFKWLSSNGKKRPSLVEHAHLYDEDQTDGIRIVNYPSEAQERIVGTLERIEDLANPEMELIPDLRMIETPPIPLSSGGRGKAA